MLKILHIAEPDSGYFAYTDCGITVFRSKERTMSGYHVYTTRFPGQQEGHRKITGEVFFCRYLDWLERYTEAAVLLFLDDTLTKGQFRFTREQVEDIVYYYESGWKVRDLSLATGAHSSTINYILRDTSKKYQQDMEERKCRTQDATSKPAGPDVSHAKTTPTAIGAVVTGQAGLLEKEQASQSGISRDKMTGNGSAKSAAPIMSINSPLHRKVA